MIPMLTMINENSIKILIFSPSINQPKITPKTGDKNPNDAIVDAGYIERIQNQNRKPTATIITDWKIRMAIISYDKSLMRSPNKKDIGIKTIVETTNW